MTRAYAVVVRRAPANWSADCPDLPGCVATGRTVDETLRRMRSALALHIDGLGAQGATVPRPRTSLSTLVRRHGDDALYTTVLVAA